MRFSVMAVMALLTTRSSAFTSGLTSVGRSRQLSFRTYAGPSDNMSSFNDEKDDIDDMNLLLEAEEVLKASREILASKQPPQTNPVEFAIDDRDEMVQEGTQVQSVDKATKDTALANPDDGFIAFIRKALVKAAKAAGTSISEFATSTTDAVVTEAQALPSKVGKAIEQKAQETVETVTDAVQTTVRETTDKIISIPRNAADAVKEAAQDTADAIAKIPGQTAAAVKGTAQEIADDIKETAQEIADEIKATPGRTAAAVKATAQEIADEIKATPGRVAESTRKAVTKVTDDTKQKITDTVDEVTSFSKRTVNEFQEAIDDLTGGSKKEPPAPPKFPPPDATDDGAGGIIDAVEGAIENLTGSDEKKPPVPPTFPPQQAKKPNPELPKISFPKTEPPKTQPRKAEDSLVFSELSLQKFVNLGRSQQDMGASSVEREAEALNRELKQAQAEEIRKKAAAAKKQAAMARSGQPVVEPKQVAAAPRGVPTISNWKQNRDGTIVGSISGSPNFNDGDSVTTSPIGDKAVGGSLVETVTGSKYFLGPESQKSGLFGFFGGVGGDLSSPAPAANVVATSAGDARKAAAEAAAEERRARDAQVAEERRREVEAKQQEIAEKKAAAEKEKRAKAAQVADMKAAADAAAEERRRQAEIKSKATSTRVVPKLAVAPRGVPTIVDWKQLRDGSIEGKIFGSPNFDDGDRVETSVIVDGDVSNGSVVKTGSGSKYFLSDDQKIKEQNKKAALKAIGSAKKGATISLSFFRPKEDDGEENSRRDADKKAASDAAEERKREAEAKLLEKKQQEARRVALEQKNKKMAELKAAVEEEKRAKTAQAAEERSRRAAEMKAAADVAAEERRRQAEVKKQEEEARRVALEQKQREMAEIKAAVEEEKRAKAAEAAEERSRRAAEMKAAADAAAEERRRQAEIKSRATSTRVVPKLAVAPRGVPTIVDWKQRRDGTIEGKIFGSPNFDDGDRVETSAIVDGDVSNGSVVKTGSGSKYFLSDDQKIKEQNKKAALKAIGSAKKGATISLSSFFRPNDDDAASPAIKVGSTKAPKGVPSLVNWRKNGDGSVSGIISGSPNFAEGERITTSPIASGTVKAGEVVKTGSGSKYFLV